VDKFTLWFKPTGYRPADVAEKYPVYKIEDVYHFEKYDTKTSPLFNAWCWVQLTMILLFISYLFGNIAYINSMDNNYIYWYGAFIFLTVYAISELMDRTRYAISWEVLRSGLGFYFLYQQQDWFGVSQWLSIIKYLLGVYFIISILVSGWFSAKHRKEDLISLALK
jgi:hypothetical protein